MNTVTEVYLTKRWTGIRQRVDRGEDRDVKSKSLTSDGQSYEYLVCLALPTGQVSIPSSRPRITA